MIKTEEQRQWLESRYKEMLGTGWQTRLAKLLNVAPQTVRRWVAGKTPLPQWLQRIDTKTYVGGEKLTSETVYDRNEARLTVSFRFGEKPFYRIDYSLLEIPVDQLAFNINAMASDAEARVQALQPLGANLYELSRQPDCQQVLDDFFKLVGSFWESV